MHSSVLRNYRSIFLFLLCNSVLNDAKVTTAMSAKDKENKPFHEKLKQFFRINKGGAGTSTTFLLRCFLKNGIFLFSYRLTKIVSNIIQNLETFILIISSHSILH